MTSTNENFIVEIFNYDDGAEWLNAFEESSFTFELAESTIIDESKCWKQCFFRVRHLDSLTPVSIYLNGKLIDLNLALKNFMIVK